TDQNITGFAARDRAGTVAHFVRRGRGAFVIDVFTNDQHRGITLQLQQRGAGVAIAVFQRVAEIILRAFGFAVQRIGVFTVGVDLQHTIVALDLGKTTQRDVFGYAAVADFRNRIGIILAELISCARTAIVTGDNVA